MMKQNDSDVCETQLLVSGMDCASCVSHVDKAIRNVHGVHEVNVNLAQGKARVRFDPSQVGMDRIAQAATDAGYPTSIPSDDAGADRKHHEEADDLHARGWRRRAIVGVLLWAPAEALHWIIHWTSPHSMHGITWMTWLGLVTSTAAIVYIGGAFYRSAFAAARRGTTNMDTLIALGASVAYGYSLVSLIGALAGAWQLPDHLYFVESTALLALISVGHWLETRARGKAGAAIRQLLELAPDTALRLPPKKKRLLSLGVIQANNAVAQVEQEVPVRDLVVGDRVLVKPGMRVPIDGEVESGTSDVDESMLTGEPLPVTRTTGDKVIGGTLNRDGALTVRVTAVGADTALAQIIRLVDDAQNAKPPVQQLADRISAIFVPTVLVLALLVGVGWYIYGSSVGWESREMWGKIANTVCSVLIIACPCALGLALPAALMVSTGWGARNGILIRNLDALQRGERVKTVVLDKTGTITLGKPRVASILSVDDVFERELLFLAGSAELQSEHPLGQAIVQAARERGIELQSPESFVNEPGVGVKATVQGRRVFVGRDAGEPEAGGVGVFLVKDGGERRLIGRITLADTVREDSREAIARLHALGVTVVMLTGDHESTAKQVAAEVGIDRIIAGVKPDGKAQTIALLKSELRPGESIIMIGDGINDAPALAGADLGIAVGSGSDIAKQSAGIVLVRNSLHGAVNAIELSRLSMRKIRQNLFWAFFYNVLAIPAAALGVLSPTIAALAMALSDVTVIGNALLIRTQMERRSVTTK
jgi:Cu+-exporting ATPase